MTRELTLAEYMTVDGYLHRCGWKRHGAKIFFDSHCPFGQYSALTDRITIMEEPTMLKEITPCIVHELTHREQRRRFGVIVYAFLNLTRFILEKEAKRNETEAERILGVKYG